MGLRYLALVSESSLFVLAPAVFEWLFQLAPVSVPILGADSLHHHNLLLDVANQKVFSSFLLP